jgi:putative ABC transport system permease protein
VISRIRAVFAGSALLAWRRARRDVSLVLVWTLLLTVSAGIAVAAPRFVVATVDAGAREAVAEAGGNADLIATTEVGAPRQDRAATVPPTEITGLAETLRGNLPPGIASAYRDTTVTVLGPRSVAEGNPALDVRVGMLDPEVMGGITVVEGTLPQDELPAPEQPFPVAVSSAAATASGFALGSEFVVPATDLGIPVPVPVVVVAIIDAVDAESPLWADLPGLWTAPSRQYRGDPLVTLIPLATPAVVDEISALYSDPFSGTIRIHLDPTVFTSALVAQVSEEERALRANTSDLTSSIPYPVVVSKGFADALEGFADQARAAVAQLSLIIAGVLGVAATVLVLTSRLLVLRRRPEMILERARGSSTLATVVRTVPQAMLTTVFAVAIVLIIAPGPIDSPAILAIVVATGLLAEPLNALVLARSTGTARRAPANRQDRAVLVARARVRRIAIEVTVVLLAAAALVSFVARGLLQGQTMGIDPLLSAAPLLVAAAVTIVVVRVYPLPVRLAAGLAVRSQGIHGLIGSVRARRAIAVLPLLALTIATGLASTNALLDDTVARGQDAASWQQVGADLRITTTLDEAQREAIEQAPGVTAVSSFDILRETRIELGTNIGITTALAIDDEYPEMLAALPEAGETDELTRLFAEPTEPSEPTDSTDPTEPTEPTDSTESDNDIPALVDSDIAGRALSDTIVMRVGQENVRLRIVGTYNAPERGFVRAPFVYVPLTALNARLGEPVLADTTLVVGSGAERAAIDAGVASDDVISRIGWLDNQRSGALVGGVQQGVAASTLLVALFAVIGLLATVAAGSRERARTLSLLRTLGTPSRFGWWLALSDLAPLVLAAILGGIGAGVVVAMVLFPALGIGALTGGVSSAALVVDVASAVPIVLGGIALVVVAILAEVLMRRRDRLNEVLRVGETV